MTYEAISLTKSKNQADAVSQALSAAEVGLIAVDAEKRVRETINGDAIWHLIRDAKRVFAVTLGKASAALLDGIRSELSGRLNGTASVGARNYPYPRADFVAMGNHPFPGLDSANAARGLREFIDCCELTCSDLVLVGVTGGATAMLTDPLLPLEPCDLRAVSTELLSSGIDVTEANALRQVLSRLHAGGLLDCLSPAHVVGLIICDNVQIGDAGVGSGLTFSSSACLEKASEVAQRCLCDLRLLERVRAALRTAPTERGTTVPVTNFHVTGGVAAVEAIAAYGAAQEFDVFSLGSRLQGPATEVAAKFAGLLTSRRTRPALVVGGGEVTVEVRGDGDGGRCQELAWLVGRHLDCVPGVGFAAVASDGCDFLPHSAGAWIDGGSVAAARLAGIDLDTTLAVNDSYSAHAMLGQIVRHAPGRTNVCDLYVGCVLPRGA